MLLVFVLLLAMFVLGQLVVLVVRSAEPEANRLKPKSAWSPFATRLQLLLCHVDTRVDALVGFFTWHTVDAVNPGDGNAEETVGPDAGDAGAEALGVDEGVVLTTARGVIVVGRTFEGITMHNDAVAAGCRAESAIAPLINGTEAAFDLTGEPLRRHERRDTLVFDRYDAADGATAVAQGGRSAHHFDAIGTERVDWHGVIFGHGRDVVRADAVFLNTYAVAVEAANDRTVGAGRESRTGDARFRLQHVSDGCALLREDLTLAHHCHWSKSIVNDNERPSGQGTQWRRCRPCELCGGYD